MRNPLLSLNYSVKVAHYGWFSRCNIPSGQCFDNILFLDIAYEHFETLKPIMTRLHRPVTRGVGAGG